MTVFLQNLDSTKLWLKRGIGIPVNLETCETREINIELHSAYLNNKPKLYYHNEHEMTTSSSTKKH